MQVKLADQEVALLVMGYLEDKGWLSAMTAMEEESGFQMEDFGKELNFLRKLILRGEWKNAEDFIKPLQSSVKEDYARVLFAVRKQQFLELLDDVESRPELPELVKVLKALEELCSRSEFKELCFFLTLSDIREHGDYRSWTVSRGRYETFQSMLKVLHPLYGSLPDSDKTKLSSGKRLQLLLERAVLHQASQLSGRNGEKLLDALAVSGATSIALPVLQDVVPADFEAASIPASAGEAGSRSTVHASIDFSKTQKLPGLKDFTEYADANLGNVGRDGKPDNVLPIEEEKMEEETNLDDVDHADSPGLKIDSKNLDGLGEYDASDVGTREPYRTDDTKLRQTSGGENSLETPSHNDEHNDDEEVENPYIVVQQSHNVEEPDSPQVQEHRPEVNLPVDDFSYGSKSEEAHHQHKAEDPTSVRKPVAWTIEFESPENVLQSPPAMSSSRVRQSGGMNVRGSKEGARPGPQTRSKDNLSSSKGNSKKSVSTVGPLGGTIKNVQEFAMEESVQIVSWLMFFDAFTPRRDIRATNPMRLTTVDLADKRCLKYGGGSQAWNIDNNDFSTPSFQNFDLEHHISRPSSSKYRPSSSSSLASDRSASNKSNPINTHPVIVREPGASKGFKELSSKGSPGGGGDWKRSGGASRENPPGSHPHFSPATRQPDSKAVAQNVVREDAEGMEDFESPLPSAMKEIDVLQDSQVIRTVTWNTTPSSRMFVYGTTSRALKFGEASAERISVTCFLVPAAHYDGSHYLDSSCKRSPTITPAPSTPSPGIAMAISWPQALMTSWYKW
eukprot:765784-Hanusia_phi.AAC.2